MEKIYIVCRKVDAFRANVLEGALDDYVLKSVTRMKWVSISETLLKEQRRED